MAHRQLDGETLVAQSLAARGEARRLCGQSRELRRALQEMRVEMAETRKRAASARAELLFTRQRP